MNPRQSSRRMGAEYRLVPRLAWADLRHDWVLSCCLILALSAVVAPLLLLFGLKFGYIQTLRHRLIQNPSNRELRPLGGVDRSREWFRDLAARPEVGFLVPSIRALASPMIISRAEAKLKDNVDLMPSADGDTLLVENKKPVPKGREVVLTAQTAQAIDAKPGDRITLTALGSEQDTHASVDMKVIAVLDITAIGVKGVYAPLPFVEAVEAYKDGHAVPEFNWPGSQPVAKPVFDGAIIVSPQALSPDQQNSLCLNTGFSYINEVPRDKLEQLAGWTLPPGPVVYHLQTFTNPAPRDSLAIVKEKLREAGTKADVIPWTQPTAVTLSAPGVESVSVQVQGLSIPADRAREIGIEPFPPWTDDAQADLSILLPTGVIDSGEVQLAPAQSRAALSLPVKVAGTSGRRAALVPGPLAGVLRLVQSRRLGFDAQSGQILLLPLGYSGFRLYARTIDDIEPLRRVLANDGVNVSTAAQEVAKVMELDRNLTRVFALIALTGIGGGIAALVTSLYASVERKRRELGTLRLIGLSRRSLVTFPIFQGLILVAASFGCATVFFLAASKAIDGLFRNFREANESFCHLPASYFFLSLACSLVLGMLAAVAAAARISSASAADALRDE